MADPATICGDESTVEDLSTEDVLTDSSTSSDYKRKRDVTVDEENFKRARVDGVLKRPTEGVMRARQTPARLDATRLTVSNTVWYMELSKHRQEACIQKLTDLRYMIDLPSMDKILALNIPDVHIKELYEMHNNVSSMNRMDVQRDILANKLNERFTFYSDSQNHKLIETMASMTKKVPANIINQKILNTHYTDDVKNQIYQRTSLGCSDDGYKSTQWVTRVLDLPSVRKEPLMKCPGRMLTILNDKIYGLQRAKEEIVSHIITIFEGRSEHKAMGLCSPPGVGKTMIVRIIAEALGLPFRQISLGGVTDASYLEGHSYTYVGSQSGIIVDSMISMKCTNGILFLDEIDKVGDTQKGKEVENALLHIIDFTQNHDYRDKYMPEIPVDLSDVFFIFSMNSTSNMSAALISRIPVINLEGYTTSERVEIARLHLIPNACRKYHIALNIGQKTIEYLIKQSQKKHDLPQRCGVREVLHDIHFIASRIKLYMKIPKASRHTLSYTLCEPYDVVTTNTIDTFINAREHTLSYYT